METRENGVQVWKCSNCGWARPYPQLVQNETDSRDGLLRAFVRHLCAEHPRGRRARKDVNQVAARIAREATERDQ